MKDILGGNNYRFGVETFLLMYLNQYQFVLGSDLDSYAQANEVFTEDNPCNIYFVLRRPKVTVDPNPIKIDGNKANLNFIIHNKDEVGMVNVGFEFQQAQSELEFRTEYPYNLFTLSDKNGVLLGARPSTLIDSIQLKDNIDVPFLDYEVLYIGQAYGINGKRTALDRLSTHETVQKIYTHSLTQYPDSDIWILLTNFSQQSMLFSAPNDLIKTKKEDSQIEIEKEKHFFNNNGISLTEKQRINFTEAALIKYFQPKYNKEFKNSFPSAKHKSYSECYDLDIKALTIELDTSENTRRIFTENTERTHRHMKMFEFNSDADRISFMKVFG
ncbi:hypothetical protein [Seonamhaeicola sp.]|uniref:hypothetical protein n=1 Tax=Seonamhaeicola sp. TaxID=1912245 RepID=UPI002633061E|nr:hypothetical protein [Seonamhaeicola sp.]